MQIQADPDNRHGILFPRITSTHCSAGVMRLGYVIRERGSSTLRLYACNFAITGLLGMGHGSVELRAIGLLSEWRSLCMRMCRMGNREKPS